MTEQDPGLPGKQPVVEVPVAGLPGEQQTAQVPIANLPGEYQTAQLPVGGLSGGQPGIYQPVAEVPAPARKPIVLPAVLAVALFLAAGAFVALWLIERGDHKATTGQLDGVRAEIVDVEKKTGAAQTAYTEAETKLKASEKGLADKKAEADRNKPCMEASQELIRALMADDLRAGEAAGFLIVERCK